MAIATDDQELNPYTVRVAERCGTNLHVSRSNPYFQLFASFPEDKSFISQVVISYIANQVNLPKSSYSDYDWQGRSAKVYRVEIRRLFNFRVASVQDSEKMVTWLIEEILPDKYHR